MKILILFLLCFGAVPTYGQEPPFDGHHWEAPYHLPIPAGWTIERFLIPISFAPQIRYKGVEDIRFAPGWGDAKSEEYWSYAFLWYLDGTPLTTAAIIEEHIQAYYTGLMRINTDSAKLAALPERDKRVRTSFKEIAAQGGDGKTFEGTVDMLDYMQLKPIRLHCTVHVQACAEEQKTILFHALSPRPYTHKIWTAFNRLWADFSCRKK